MAKITEEARNSFKEGMQPILDNIKKSGEKEASILELCKKDTSGNAYKKLLLCDEMLYIASEYITINNLSLKMLEVKNNDALNDSRKALYKAIIYLEEIVTNVVDCPFSELEDKQAEISNMPMQKRYYLVRKMGLAIRLLIDAFGDNSKWKWSFVELEGRYATVSKNLLNMKSAVKDYFDPRAPDYDNTVYYIRLLKKLADKSANAYRDRYELSTRRIDDMRNGINYLLAERRICMAISEADQAEEIKKKAIVWKEKMEADQKAGTSK